MKKFLSFILIVSVFAGSFVLPTQANAASTAKAGGCAIRITSGKLKQISRKAIDHDPDPDDDPDAVSGAAVISVKPTVTYMYKYEVKVDVLNAGKRTVSRTEIKGNVAGKTHKINTDKIEPGEKVTRTVSFESEKKLSSGNKFHKTVITAYYPSEKDIYRFATSDHYTPVISGFIKSGSYESMDGEIIPYQTVYRSQKNSYNYKKYIRVNDKKAKVTVDTSNVDFNRKGIYTVRYKATDKAGNSQTVTAKIAVRLDNDTLDRYAAQVLSSITRKNASAKSKARAICKYVNGHLGYSGHHRSYNWESEAIAGLRYRNGDCFTYYSLSRALLTRAGIPNIKVKLVHVRGRHHFWNMAYVKGGFYHLDACPRRRRKIFILLTDAQLRYYATHVEYNSHVWDYAHVPKTPKKAISK